MTLLKALLAGFKARMSNRTIWHHLLVPIGIFLLSVIGILILTWPWCLHFSGEFLDHWDPPFHAWKLEFMARAILSGDPWLLRSEANVLYPHMGTLYFEALQWPPAWLAALLLKLTNWPFELIYHVVFVVFWAISGPCIYFHYHPIGPENRQQSPCILA